MLRFSPYWVRVVLAGFLCLEGVSALALEFRTTREQTIVYDNPTHHSKKLSILSPDYPVEILDRDEDGWLKVRDMSGEIGWVEDQSVGTRKRVLVRNNYAEILRRPDNNARLSFRAEKGVVLERLTNPDEDGWVRVRIPNTRQEGFIKTSQVWGIDRRKTIDAVDRTRRTELARRDWDHGDEDVDAVDRGDAYYGSTREVSSRLDQNDSLTARRRAAKVRRLEREAEERRLAAERLRKEDEYEVDSIHTASTKRIHARAIARQKHVAYRRAEDETPKGGSYYRTHIAKPKPRHKSVVRVQDNEDAEELHASPKHKRALALRKARIQDSEQLVSTSSGATTDRVSMRERLRERRLRAEREARDQGSEYRRPMMYSTSRRDVRKRQDNWERNDYTDEDRDDQLVGIPQVHR